MNVIIILIAFHFFVSVERKAIELLTEGSFVTFFFVKMEYFKFLYLVCNLLFFFIIMQYFKFLYLISKIEIILYKKNVHVYIKYK